MEIKIEKEIVHKVDTASKVMGIDRSAFVDRAILVYLDSLEKYLELKHDFKKWDELSDEALFNFEDSL